MVEISYDSYINNYCTNPEGAVPAEHFTPCLKMAEGYLQNALLGRAGAVEPKTLSACLCALAELFYKKASRQGIASENTDGYSVSYVAEALEAQLTQVVFTYFGSSGLLYRGIG